VGELWRRTVRIRQVRRWRRQRERLARPPRRYRALDSSTARTLERRLDSPDWTMRAWAAVAVGWLMGYADPLYLALALLAAAARAAAP
jgi:hypothetical protein